MDNQQPKHNDKDKPFDPIAKLVVPDLAKLSQEQRDISYFYAIYALFALGIFGLVPAIGGVIMAYAKRNELRGTIYFDHLQFLLKTFWITLIFSIIGYFTLIFLIGFLILPVTCGWYIFRVVVGFLRLRENRAITPDGWLM